MFTLNNKVVGDLIHHVLESVFAGFSKSLEPERERERERESMHPLDYSPVERCHTLDGTAQTQRPKSYDHMNSSNTSGSDAHACPPCVSSSSLKKHREKDGPQISSEKWSWNVPFPRQFGGLGPPQKQTVGHVLDLT